MPESRTVDQGGRGSAEGARDHGGQTSPGKGVTFITSIETPCLVASQQDRPQLGASKSVEPATLPGFRG
jgi:hypothetical protein